jgi:DNA-directed RNA polymerase subunit RPC12/RpoP
MVYKCYNCGAKLKIDQTSEIIVCEYCASVNKIELKRSETSVNVQVQTKKPASVIGIISVVAVLFIGLIAYYIMRQSPQNNEITIEGVSPYSYQQDGGYLIDQNNDGIMDIATMAMLTSDSQYEIQILDGKTGSILASAESDF